MEGGLEDRRMGGYWLRFGVTCFEGQTPADVSDFVLLCFIQE